MKVRLWSQTSELWYGDWLVMTWTDYGFLWPAEPLEQEVRPEVMICRPPAVWRTVNVPVGSRLEERQIRDRIGDRLVVYWDQWGLDAETVWGLASRQDRGFSLEGEEHGERQVG